MVARKKTNPPKPKQDDAPDSKPQRLRSKSGVGRYYKGHVKREKNTWNEFQKMLSNYGKTHEFVNYKAKGGFGKLAGKIWAEAAGSSLETIREELDVFVRSEMLARNITEEEFNNEYDNFQWWDVKEDLFGRIREQGHLLPGDKLNFDGNGLVNSFTLDLANVDDYENKAQIIWMQIRRLIYDQRKQSDDIPVVGLYGGVQIMPSGQWSVDFKLDVSDNIIEMMAADDRKIMLDDDELEKLDIERYGEDIFEKEKETQQERDQRFKEKREKLREKKEKERGEGEEVKLEKAKAETEKERQKTLQMYKDMGYTKKEIAKLEKERMHQERAERIERITLKMLEQNYSIEEIEKIISKL